MEKIIYNTKLKKLLIVLSIVVLLSNFIVPISFAVVDAEKSFFYYKYCKKNGIRDWYKYNPEDEEEQENWDKDTYYFTEDFIRYMKINFGTDDSSIFEGETGENAAKYYNPAIEAGCNKYNTILEEEYNKNPRPKLSEAVTKAATEAAEVMNEYNDGTTIDSISDLTETLDEIEEDTDWDIGGILLSPVFYLVNFIADAITSNLGRIMMGDGISLISGFKVLTSDKPESNYEKTDTYEINIDSFVFGEIQYPNVKYSPEEIFSGEVDLLSIDFISGRTPERNEDGSVKKDAYGNTIYSDNSNSGWMTVRNVISQWYKVLRMIAIIGLLSVLIYTGIKIIISANAKDKAKYKEWIINWFIAVAILFAMHYIMSFIISVTGEINELLGESCQGIYVKPYTVDEYGKKIFDADKEFTTNLMGLVRYMVQSENLYLKIGYEIMYIALIVYTIKFTVVYLKRVLNMAFLTLIAPIVALTYPIDKINDGRAQGFDMWLKEYIFNALLQPMHYIMYYILVGSAVSIAASNPLYGIVVLAFMTEAEKLLKKIFGFDKAGGGTVGGMTGAFAAGAIASNIKNIAKLAGGKGGNGGKGGSGNSEVANNLLDNVKPEKDDGIADEKNGFFDSALDGGQEQQQRDEQQEEQRTTEQQQGGQQRVEQQQEAQQQVEQQQEGQQQVEQQQEEQHAAEEQPDDGVGENTFAEKAKNAVLPIRNMAQRKYEEHTSPETREKIARVGKGTIKGVKNLAKSASKPFYDWDRKGTDYNKERWKRRGVKALKGVGKAAIGVSFGAAAAAVQAGISITDGKYNPMEGLATFSAGYAGGSKLAGSVGGKISNSFKEGYYDSEEGRKELIKKKQKEFMYRDDIDKKYKEDWGEKAEDMKELASKHLVSYGITDPKKQKQILKLAKEIAGKDASKEKWDAAVKRARRTSGFIDQLESQGQRRIITSPDKQGKYIEAMLKAENVTADSERGKQIKKDYEAAFKSAAQWYQVNS